MEYYRKIDTLELIERVMQTSLQRCDVFTQEDCEKRFREKISELFEGKGPIMTLN